MSQSRLHFSALGVAVALIVGLLTAPAAAQFGGGQGGGGQFGGGGAGGFGGAGGAGGQRGGAGGRGGGIAGGIYIDAQGVVSPAFAHDKKEKLDEKRRHEIAGKWLPSDLNSFSPLRKISLVQLEAACEAALAKKQIINEEMQYLAGLQRIDYIFVYPDEKDLVIAGPAEGFVFDDLGRARGLTTGRPPLRIDSLIVALRALERGGPIGCSIDPVPANLAALKAYVAQNSSATSPSEIKLRYERMAQILGMQDVRVFGVPAESHFSAALVEADYRMKRLSMGVDHPPIRGLKSHLAMIKHGANTVQRWWFTPLYTALNTTSDRLAFRISGQRVQLMAQEELVSDSGLRTNSTSTPVSVQRYAKQFTEKYQELADASPTFAKLQNLFDLAVMAAILKKEQLPGKVGWTPSLFLDEERAAVAAQNVPRQVPSVANCKATTGLYIGLIGGGVTIDPLQTLNEMERAGSGTDESKSIRRNPYPENLPEKHIWWWD